MRQDPDSPVSPRLSQSARPLTPDQRRFCHEFAIDHNSTHAYRRIHPSSSYAAAAVSASRLLRQAKIRREIETIEAANLKAANVTARRVLRELAYIAFVDPIDLWRNAPDGSFTLRRLDEIPPRARRAIQSMQVRRESMTDGENPVVDVEQIEFHFHDKVKALGMLAKHLGLFDKGAGLPQLLELLQMENNSNGSSKQPTSNGKGVR